MENYEERRYKSILKIIKILYPYASNDEKRNIEEILPELKESEDERIRKDIIAFIERNKRPIAPVPSDDTLDKWIAWLEKQGNISLTGDELEALRIAAYEPTKNWSEKLQSLYEKLANCKQGKQKPIDKVEPKFKVGDWIVQKNIGVYKVIEIYKSWYEVIDFEGNHYSISFDNEHMCHLWTIQDAKDGDVIVNDFVGGTCIAIYKSFTDIYCHLVNNDFCPKYGTSNAPWHPSTKEQCDFFFQKMKEAGYEWDVKKKELRKIEQESTWNEKIKGLNELETYILSLVPDRSLDAIKVDAKNIRYIIDKEQNPDWSEEDENGLGDALWAIKQASSIAKDENDMGNLWYAENWLKSLKDRVQYQPKQEWNEEDEKSLDSILNDLRQGAIPDNDDINWLKSLKDRVHKPKQEWSEEE